MPADRQRRLAIHLSLGLLLCTSMIGVAVLSNGPLRAQLVGSSGYTVDIALEHRNPVALSLEMSTLHGKAMLSFGHDATEPVALSVPEQWQRMEVRGAALSDVIADDPQLGFVRWLIPAGARVTFLSPILPTAILMHNPDATALKVNLTAVDLETEAVVRDVILVKDTPARIL